VVTLSVLIILFPLGYSVVSNIFTFGSQPAEPFLELPDKNLGQCVRETEYMRFHHMDLLKEIREEFVRYGNRGEIGLNSCRECHVNRERFCNECHDAVSLNVDCFGCHYYPETVSETSSLGK
jgi:hypothetical protein